MPKITDERRAERRAQIIDAARACFDRQGPQATTMDDIIRSSGLSSGAVYGYFESKDELIVAALTAALAGLQELLDPLFHEDPPLSPLALVHAISAGVVAYSARETFDLRRVAVQGWAEAQRNEPLRTTLRAFYRAYRDRLAGIAEVWKRSGAISPSSEPDDIGKMLLALFLGFVAQSTILGDVEPAAMDQGLRDLFTATADTAPLLHSPRLGKNKAARAPRFQRTKR